MKKTNSERAQNEHLHEELMRTDGSRTAADIELKNVSYIYGKETPFEKKAPRS